MGIPYGYEPYYGSPPGYYDATPYWPYPGVMHPYPGQYPPNNVEEPLESLDDELTVSSRASSLIMDLNPSRKPHRYCHR